MVQSFINLSGMCVSAKCEISLNCTGFSVSDLTKPLAPGQTNLHKPHSRYTGHWDDLEAVNSQIHFTAGMQITEKCWQFSEGGKPMMAQQKFAISTSIWVLKPSIQAVRSRLCFSVALPRVSPVSAVDWHCALLCILPVACSLEHPVLRICS